eukprot:2575767-Pyramimonas_sp.AAC.1
MELLPKSPLPSLADADATVLKDQDALDLVETGHNTRRCQYHHILRRRESCMVQETRSKPVVAHHGVRVESGDKLPPALAA